jgi:hypothetical protein
LKLYFKDELLSSSLSAITWFAGTLCSLFVCSNEFDSIKCFTSSFLIALMNNISSSSSDAVYYESFERDEDEFELSKVIFFLSFYFSEPFFI